MQPQQDNLFEHDYLYTCLSILDTKAQGLLAYDSIILAATSLVLTIFQNKVTLGSIFVFIALVVSGFSASLCLCVIWVFWTETLELENSRQLFERLLAIRNRRTLAYRSSWLLAQVSMFFLVLGIVLQRRFS